MAEVLDKGEWTNKQLQRGSGKAQTEVISCSNIIFILTTNAATDVISEHVQRTKSLLYTAEAAAGGEVEDEQLRLETLLRHKLQRTYPFTDAFVARVDRIVPFLPLARGTTGSGDPGGSDEDLPHHPLLGESMTVAKMLIEREQEKARQEDMSVVQSISARNKHTMAKLVVMDSIAEAGVRSLQKLVATTMGHRMKHALLLERGGIDRGSSVRYSANESDRKID